MILIADLVAALNAEPSDEPYLAQLLAAAVEYINEPGGRYFGPLKEITDARVVVGSVVSLSNEPVGGVIDVTRWSGSAWDPVDTSGYVLDGRLVYTTNLSNNAHIRVTYVAGYALDGSDEYDTEPAAEATWAAPEDIKQAVRMLVGHWFLNRESAVVATVSVEVAQGVSMILRKYQ